MIIGITLKDRALQQVGEGTTVIPWDSGRKLEVVLEDFTANGQAVKILRITNYGVGIRGPKPSEHIPFRSVLAAVPVGWEPFLHSLIGARRVPELDHLIPGFEVWSLIDEKTKIAASTYYPESIDHHIFGGGEVWEWRFLPVGSSVIPYNLRTGVDAQQKREKLISLLGDNSDLLSDNRLMRVLKAQTFNPLNVNNQPITTLAGYINPHSFKQRWGQPNAAVDGPYHFGDIFSPAEGHTGAHYNSWGWCFYNYLINNDLSALLLGTVGMARKCQFHLYWWDQVKSGRNPLWIDGLWRGEKSKDGKGVRGDGADPAPSKQYDLELVMAWLLFDDPLFNRAFDLRAAQVKRCDHKWWWDRSGGERMAARLFDSTFVFYEATGDVAFKNKANNMFAHMFNNWDSGSYVNNKGTFIIPKPPARGPYWSSIYAAERDYVRPWEACKLLGGMARWMVKYGVGTAFQTMFDQSLAWYWNVGTRPLQAHVKSMNTLSYPAIPGMYETAYRFNVATNEWNPEPVDNYNPVHDCFWVPMRRYLLQKFPNDAAKINGVVESAINGMLRNWEDVAAKYAPPTVYNYSPGNIGASADKINAINLSMLWSVS